MTKPEHERTLDESRKKALPPHPGTGEPGRAAESVRPAVAGLSRGRVVPRLGATRRPGRVGEGSHESAAARAASRRAKPSAGAASRRRLRTLGAWALEKFLFLNGAVAIILIGLIFTFLFREAFQALRHIPLGLFWGAAGADWDGNPTYVRMWQPNGENPKYSILPLLCGSFLVAVPAVLIAGVIGLATGIYLAEIASTRMRELVKPVIELLAGIPTIVIGFFCLATLATFLQSMLHTEFRLNAFVGAIGVSLVIIPVIASLVDDALRGVPNYLREAAYGLGATRWETITRVVLPAGVSGVTAALILGMGRALGETMIVLLATGNAAQVTLNPFVSVRTMTATIAAELGSVPEGGNWYGALFLVGSVLLTITFALNLAAEMIVGRMRRKLTL